MRCMRLTLSIALLIFLTLPTNTNAQIVSRLSLTSPDTTILALTHRIEALEATVAQLQQKLAFIKSVSPLVFDAGGDMTIRGGQISVEAAAAFSLRAGTNASIRSGNQLLVDAAGPLDLKGNNIRHNGGSVPVVCAASVPFVACSGTVGVPPPGQ
ncbi:MAG TPA: hypothetical protein VFD22_11795 [Gemmatimonadaceae bacterium]|nr:hypothetical protein [Gemmatimonadaceae bacterium]